MPLIEGYIDMIKFGDAPILPPTSTNDVRLSNPFKVLRIFFIMMVEWFDVASFKILLNIGFVAGYSIAFIFYMLC